MWEGLFARWLIALAAASLGLAASSVLIVPHLSRQRSMPGCAPDSGCAALTSSRWGRVLGVPLSFIGAAWFAALMVYLLGTGWQDGWPSVLRWALRAAAVGAVLLLIAMALERHFCPYCLAVHAASLIIWLIAEIGPVGPAEPVWLAVAAGTLGVILAGLKVTHKRHKRAVAAHHEQQFQNSLHQLVEHIRSQRLGLRPRSASVQGRWRCGSHVPAVEVTIFSDYECSDCAQADRQLREAVARFEQIGVVQKHAPLCKQCNPTVASDSAHVHACRAACVAEAAGMVAGERAFWAVHGWLLDRQAKFTDEQLTAALPGLGVPDTDAFWQAMQRPEPRRRLLDDVGQAIALGVSSTPLVLVNGMKLNGLGARDAIMRAMETAAREATAPGSALQQRSKREA